MAEIPGYQTLMLPMLKLIHLGHETIADCLPPLARDFNLSDQDLAQMLPSGRSPILNNRAHWARQYLSQAGLVHAYKRGHYCITNDGVAVLSEAPDRIDAKFLRKFPKFIEFVERSKPSKTTEESTLGQAKDMDSGEGGQTPQEQIDDAIATIESALAIEVLEAVLALSPARFETLVVDLLLAMGYGGGELERGLQTSLSGDGGIDGVINEDELGLDAVYIQAKRYTPENKVGRPALNAFVGSLTGEGATKGVFVTTSSFSRGAEEYVERVQQRIVLINGNQLARLMIKHGVGVRTRRTFVLRSVDEDYFSDA